MNVKLYQVGGSMRDEIINIEDISTDIDYAVEAKSFEVMKSYLIENGYIIFVEKPEYLTIRAKLKKTIYDFTLCRSDGEYLDARHPCSVSHASIIDDLKRRDFTMNAIARSIDDNKIIDPHNGTEDIKNKIIRAVGNPEDRLREDSLRILRALRFSITKQFKIDEQLFQAICKSEIYKLLENVSVDRKINELTKMFKYDCVATLNLLNKLPDGLIKLLFSENIWLLPTNKKIK